jgi:hypothetical protein
VKTEQNRFAKIAGEDNVAPETDKPPAKEKVVRDTFSFPISDHQLIITLRKQCLRAGVEISRSEIIRAGLYALKEMSEANLLETVGKIEHIKTGKPKQNG